MRYQPEPRRSLLDRLTDCEPDGSREAASSPTGSINSLIQSLLRDLENLFNTRSFSNINLNRGPSLNEPVPLACQVRRSIVSYGSRDFSLDNPSSSHVQQAIRLEIIRLLDCFEPRLKDVTVSLSSAQGERVLNFRIEALLHVEPVSLPTAFDTHFDINSGSYTVLS